MAVALVGTGTFIKSTINGTATTLTFSTGGAASGDLVIAYWTHTRGSLTAQLVSSAGTAYTPIDNTVNGNLGTLSAYRVLTSSETTVTSCATGSAQDSVTLSAIVLRGAKSPVSIADNSTTGTSSNPNSGGVNVNSLNAGVVVAAGMLTATAITAAPSGFGSLVSTGATDTRSVAGALAFKSTNGPGLTDPSSWTGGVSAAWVANTIVIDSTEPLPFTWFAPNPLSEPAAYQIEPGLSAAWTQYHSGITVPSTVETILPSVSEPQIIRAFQGMIGY